MMETFHQTFANMFYISKLKISHFRSYQISNKSRGGKSIKIYVYANLLSFANDECHNILLEMKYTSVSLQDYDSGLVVLHYMT